MRKLIGLYIRFLQRVLITVLLAIVYFIGFGITFALAAVFKRRLLWPAAESETYWADDCRYPMDLEHARYQS